MNYLTLFRSAKESNVIIYNFCSSDTIITHFLKNTTRFDQNFQISYLKTRPFEGEGNVIIVVWDYLSSLIYFPSIFSLELLDCLFSTRQIVYIKKGDCNGENHIKFSTVLIHVAIHVGGVETLPDNCFAMHLIPTIFFFCTKISTKLIIL